MSKWSDYELIKTSDGSGTIGACAERTVKSPLRPQIENGIVTCTLFTGSWCWTLLVAPPMCHLDPSKVTYAAIPGADSGGSCPPALDHQIYFSTNLWTIANKFAPNTLWTLFTLISDLKIVQQAVRLPRASHSNSISFCGKIVRSGLAWNRIPEHLDLNIFLGEDIPPQQHAWVLTFGHHCPTALT
jgi:hypothetical protein